VALFSWAKEYIGEDYQLAGVADLTKSTQYTWGDAAKNYPAKSGNAIYVFRRKH